MATEALRERLMEEIDKLPPDCLREVLDFVDYLLSKEGEKSTARTPDALDFQNDPLLKFIGGVSHGSLAHGINEELYGC